jgi:hypothetical protein
VVECLVRDEGIAGFKSCHSDQYLAEFHQSSGTDYGTDTSFALASFRNCTGEAEKVKHLHTRAAGPLSVGDSVKRLRGCPSY